VPAALLPPVGKGAGGAAPCHAQKNARDSLSASSLRRRDAAQCARLDERGPSMKRLSGRRPPSLVTFPVAECGYIAESGGMPEGEARNLPGSARQ